MEHRNAEIHAINRGEKAYGANSFGGNQWGDQGHGGNRGYKDGSAGVSTNMSGAIGFPEDSGNRFQTSNLMSGNFAAKNLPKNEERKKVVDLTFGPPGGPPRGGRDIFNGKNKYDEGLQ